MKTPREKAAAETWTKRQRTYASILAIVSVFFGFSLAIAQSAGSMTSAVALSLAFIGYSMAIRNLEAKYGLIPYRPSLGGVFPWAYSTAMLCDALDFNPLLSATIITVVAFPFLLHFIFTAKE